MHVCLICNGIIHATQHLQYGCLNHLPRSKFKDLGALYIFLDIAVITTTPTDSGLKKLFYRHSTYRYPVFKAPGSRWRGET